jgi:hypothetical protein
MLELKAHSKKFARDLLATKSTSIAAAVVFAWTFLPMSGGAIKPYEIHAAMAALNGERYAPPVTTRSYFVERDVVDVRPQAARRVVRVSAQDEVVDDAEFNLAGGVLEGPPAPELPIEPEETVEPPLLEEAELLEVPEVVEPEVIDAVVSG